MRRGSQARLRVLGAEVSSGRSPKARVMRCFRSQACLTQCLGAGVWALALQGPVTPL